jgi:hypothetical protein
MQHLLQLQKRKCLVVNLDPANDTFDYECALDVRELVDAAAVMEEYKLGPNGALVFCMEYLEKNLDWLQDRLKELLETTERRTEAKEKGGEESEEEAATTTGVDADFILFDCPGQVELFAMHGSFRRMVDLLTRTLDLRLVCVHCVDVQLCSDENNYMAAVLLCLNIMLNLELSHVNVWTKADTLKRLGGDVGRFAFHSDGNLERLLASCQNNTRKAALTRKLIEIIEDYSLVAFEAVAVEGISKRLFFFFLSPLRLSE